MTHRAIAPMITSALVLCLGAGCTEPEPEDASSPDQGATPAADMLDDAPTDTSDMTSQDEDMGSGVPDMSTQDMPVAPEDMADEDMTAADMDEAQPDMATADMGAPADPLAALSDEFDDPSTLSQWSRVWQEEQWPHDQLETWSIANGEMLMEPYTSAWFRDYRGVLAYKSVTGDFTVHMRVSATNRSGMGAPSRTFSLAGIMIRAPRMVTPQTWTRGGENYVFLSLGTGNTAGRAQTEVKNTTRSNSMLAIEDAPSSTAELMAVRLGGSILTLLRFPGEPWVIHRRYARGDLPGTLQVGMTAYTDWPNVNVLEPESHNTQQILDGSPDLSARFDFIRYSTPSVPARLVGRVFSDPDQISDAELLEFLAVP